MSRATSSSLTNRMFEIGTADVGPFVNRLIGTVFSQSKTLSVPSDGQVSEKISWDENMRRTRCFLYDLLRPSDAQTGEIKGAEGHYQF